MKKFIRNITRKIFDGYFVMMKSLIGWGYDGEKFVKPHREGYRYQSDGENWMLVENTLEENNIIEDLRNFRIAQNQDIINYTIDNYTKELIDNALV